jgi:hypothetical protein
MIALLAEVSDRHHSLKHEAQDIMKTLVRLIGKSWVKMHYIVSRAGMPRVSRVTLKAFLAAKTSAILASRSSADASSTGL